MPDNYIGARILIDIRSPASSGVVRIASTALCTERMWTRFFPQAHAQSSIWTKDYRNGKFTSSCCTVKNRNPDYYSIKGLGRIWTDSVVELSILMLDNYLRLVTLSHP